MFETEPRSEKIREFIVQSVPEHPKDIVTVTAQKFNVTRTTVHRHLGRLLRDHKIVQSGRTRAASYHLSNSLDKVLHFDIAHGLKEDQVWKDHFAEPLSLFSESVFDICCYAFGEIFNNAIDHSEGSRITVTSKMEGKYLRLQILDNGIGIFRKIQSHLSLDTERESILHLSKGKLTTDPERHSGEGIFFTSRVVDFFLMRSFDLIFQRENDDWTIDSSNEIYKGTLVAFTLNLHGIRTLGNIFRQYSTFEHKTETPRFDKTHILVELSKMEEDKFISRSQAKRILFSLEKFNAICFNFKGVKTVGQGFADEVFRVFQNQHPNIKIEYINANDNVKFMIERSIPK